DDLAGDHASEYGWECEINKSCDFDIELRREQDRKSPCCPQREKYGQGPILEWHSSSPIRDCGQEEASNNGGAVAEDHFVHVPHDGGEFSRDLKFAGEDPKPERNRKRRPKRPEKEEGAKAGGQQSRPALPAIARNCHGTFLRSFIVAAG